MLLLKKIVFHKGFEILPNFPQNRPYCSNDVAVFMRILLNRDLNLVPLLDPDLLYA